ncbi:MAG: DNA-directed RNA polymerase subunit beta' [Candidatus Liptonbacteria bacterium]|nr:DNA-directed RNA polymerase subunit beta' [Candidatus Liptonbacteria bacterium]
MALNIEPVGDTESERRGDFKALKIGFASPEEILKWSHGEVTKPETINYRTQRPEKDGLFSERIFGPTKDYECYCGKYRRIRYKGVVCDKCGVEVTRSIVRRDRLGHISLATPVSHIWFFKSVPSRLSLILDTSSIKLERVLYYSAYIVTEVSEEGRKRSLEELSRELKGKLKIVSKDKKIKGEITASAADTRVFLGNLRPGHILSESEYFNLARRFGDIFKAGMGAEAVREILEKMDLRKEVQKIEKILEEAKNPISEVKQLQRLKMFKAMIKNGSRPEWLIMTVLPILPPDLRPMVALDGGRYATSDLNDLYRRVINRNNRLKKLIEIRAPEVIVRNEKRMLQEAVDALIDNSARFGTQQLSSQRRPLRSLADMLKGKQGRFRQNLLGKRVDYSGRSVIVVGPKLKLDECGLPKRMALELFRPFVLSQVIKKGLAHNIRSANRIMEQGGDEVWAILEEVIKDRRVLLNRAPTLHRLSIQAFRPLLIEGLAIQIPPLVCTAFNADFDGDQMAVHLPLSEYAQKEAQVIMASGRNLLKPATGELITTPTKDIVLGIYYLTLIDSVVGEPKKIFLGLEEAVLAYELRVIGLQTPIRVGEIAQGKNTTVGRLLFNQALSHTHEFVNDAVDRKKLSRILEAVSETSDFNKMREVLDNLKILGFEAATKSGITWAISDLIIPKEKQRVLKEAESEVELVRDQFIQGLLTGIERQAGVIDIWVKAKSEVAKLVSATLPKNNSIYQIIDSGSRGSWAQPIQMMGMKGLVQNARGETIELPIKSSLKEGLSVLEYFISTHGARKGTTDTALKTAQAGYLTRRLVDVSQDLMVRDVDCRTKEGIVIMASDGEKIGHPFSHRLFSRTAALDVKLGNKILVRAGEVIDKKKAELIQGSKIPSVKIRSPITCKSIYGICSRCYGFDLGSNQPVKLGAAVGVIAAQSIGEPGTQLTMRTFHIGGIAGADITHGLPRVEEIFEVRPPKGKAILSQVNGVVEKIEEKGTLKTIIVKAEDGKKKAYVKSKKDIEYSVPRSVLLSIKVGDKVERGDQLSEGNIDLRELLEFKGSREVERYIINEVQGIYISEGAMINDKHIEVIVRQMFSRVKVKATGDAPDLVMGEIIEKSKFLEINREIKKQGGEGARGEQILLGVTRVALSTESFLSAASFQDTSRVLVKAAIEGRVDPLRGLKENVIIGRLIPAGEIPESVDTSQIVKDAPMVPTEGALLEV